jgi:hypothetical protein
MILLVWTGLASVIRTGTIMTSEEFHALVEDCSDESGEADRDAPLTLAELARLERQKGVRFPPFYKDFISTYGAGEFGSVTVLSPDPNSRFTLWETTSPFGEPRVQLHGRGRVGF